MNDNQLVALFITTINAALALQSISVGVKQGEQPTQQGAPSAPCVFFFKIGDKRYGFPQKADIWDAETETMTHSETQVYLTTFQVSALAIQDPTNTTQLTASDYVNAVAVGIANQASTISLAASGVGIDRITAVRQTFFKDDGARNEASPSFDVTLCHTRVMVTPQNSTATLIGNLDPVSTE